MTCELSQEFLTGVEQFNQRQFYECHDTLEAIWMDSVEPEKTFYQGVLQIAVGLYHLGNRNWQGSVTLLGNGIHRLSPYQPDYNTVDVNALVQQSQQVLHALQSAGPDHVGAIALQLETSEAQESPIEEQTLLTCPRILLL